MRGLLNFRCELNQPQKSHPTNRRTDQGVQSALLGEPKLEAAVQHVPLVDASYSELELEPRQKWLLKDPLLNRWTIAAYTQRGQSLNLSIMLWRSMRALSRKAVVFLREPTASFLGFCRSAVNILRHAPRIALGGSILSISSFVSILSNTTIPASHTAEVWIQSTRLSVVFPRNSSLFYVLPFWGPLCFPLTRQKDVFVAGALIPA